MNDTTHMNELVYADWLINFDELKRTSNSPTIEVTEVIDETFKELTNAAFEVGDKVWSLQTGLAHIVAAVNVDAETVSLDEEGYIMIYDVSEVEHAYPFFGEQLFVFRVLDQKLAEWMAENPDSVSNCGFRIGQDENTDDVFIGLNSEEGLDKKFELLYKLFISN